MRQTKVMLGVEEPFLQEEILHFLDRLPQVRVVGATGEGAQVARRVREHAAAVAVVSPAVLREARDLDGAAVLVVAAEERTADLRLALRSGARGFYVWPEEREELGRHASRITPPPQPEERPPGRVVAVYGPRGGVGATFLATNLAAAFAREKAETVLVDLDLSFGDVTVALGIPSDGGHKTIAHLTSVLDEVVPEQVDPVLHEHPAGFRVLLAPGEPSATGVGGAQVARLVRALRSRFAVVVVHLPRAFDDAVRGALEACDDVLMVITLDVLAFRDARRALELMGESVTGERWSLVVNRAFRSEIVPEDTERVLGKPPLAVIMRDPAVPRAQNRGELVAGRSGRAARAVRSLARRLLESVEGVAV